MRTDDDIMKAVDRRMAEIKQHAATRRGVNEPLAEAGLQVMQAQIEMLIDLIKELRGDIKILTDLIAEAE